MKTMLVSSPMQKSLSKGQLGLVMLAGIGLIQSTIIGGLNFSIADPVLAFLLATLIIRRDAEIPVLEVMFLGSVFIIRTVISIALPAWLLILNPVMAGSMVKLTLVIIYFLTGYLIGQHVEALKSLVQVFVVANIIVGVIGIILMTWHLNSWAPFMFLAYRFRGLMNDPNYFALLQLMCLPFVSVLWSRRPAVKLILTTCLVVAALLSGSKSAMIVLCLYGVFKITIGFWRLWRHARFKQLIGWGLVISIVGLSGMLLLDQFAAFIQWFGTINPSFERVATLLSGDSPLSENGSGRTDAWLHAFTITNVTNGLGIGFHDYAIVAGQLIGDSVIAHNTVLQLLVEWGIIPTFVFICYLGYRLWQSIGTEDALLHATTMALLISFVFSMSISLNNSRIFWLFLAIWVAQLVKKKSIRSS